MVLKIWRTLMVIVAIGAFAMSMYIRYGRVVTTLNEMSLSKAGNILLVIAALLLVLAVIYTKLERTLSQA